MFKRILGLLNWNLVRSFAEEGGGDGGAGGDAGGGDAGGGGEAWHSGVSWGEDYTPSERVTEFKSVPELARGYENALDKINSKGIIVPGENADDQAKSAFQASLKEHLGMNPPENADGYTWKPSDESKKFFDGYKDQMKQFHEAGYDDQTVSRIMDNTAKGIEQAFEAIQNTQAEVAKQSEAALREKWAGTYDDRMTAIAQQAEQFPDAYERLKANGLANDQTILEMLDLVARSVSEKAPVGGQGDSQQSAQQALDTIKAGDAYQNKRHAGHNEAIRKVHELQKILVQQ